MRKTDAIEPPIEDCLPDELPVRPIAAPENFDNSDGEYSLHPVLREAARTKDPWRILARAAGAFHHDAHPDPQDYQLGFTPATHLQTGNALADLAVTGRTAYGRFQQTPGFLHGAVYQGLQDSLAAPGSLPLETKELLTSLSNATAAEFASDVDRALDRAYAVAWAIRGPVPQPAAARLPLAWLASRSAPGGLGWIAVSGEDDKPHRPVNLVPPPFEQYEILVTTHGLPVQTRFFIAAAREDPPPPVTPSKREPPPNPIPNVPGGHQVILFLHGDCSSAEEALAIIPHILEAGRADGTDYAVISLDLPNNGYSASFGHEKVAPLSATKWDNGPIFTPILDYLEDFVVAFVNALDEITPIKNRFAGIIGGSLGGNLGLRLGRRPLALNPWLDAGIVSWDAASVWGPMVMKDGCGVGPHRCLANAAEPEGPETRRAHFVAVYDRPNIDLGFVAFGPTQPQTWYRDDWPCKAFHIAASRVARQEIYDANFRRWHWRLSGEQLIYSHSDRVIHDDDTSPYRYELNTVRHLLVAGSFDDYFPCAQIYSNTQDLADKMVATPGTSLFLKNTGHSIHFERPHYFGGEIAKFLKPTPAVDLSFLATLLLERSHSPVVADGSFLVPLLLGPAG